MTDYGPLDEHGARKSGEDEPTWEISVGMGRYGMQPQLSPTQLAQAVPNGWGARITTGLGVWEDQVEYSGTITFQGPQAVFEQLVRNLVQILPGMEKFAHVEKRHLGGSRVTWLDLDPVRRQVHDAKAG